MNNKQPLSSSQYHEASPHILRAIHPKIRSLSLTFTPIMKELPRLLRYIRPYWGRAVLNLVFNILSVVFSLFSLAMVVPVLELLFRRGDEEYAQLLAHPPGALEFSAESLKDHFYFQLAGMIQEGGKLDALVFLCGLILMLFFFKNLFRYGAKFYLSPVRAFMVRDLRRDLFDKTLALPLTYYSEERKGDLIAKLTGDVQEIENSIINGLEALFRDPINVLVFFGTLLFMSPQLTLFVVVLFPVTGWLIGTVGKSLRRASTRTQQKMGELLSAIEESLWGIRIIKAFSAEDKVRRRFARVNELAGQHMTQKYRKRDMASPMSEFLGVIVMVVVLWFGGRLVLSGEGELSASVFIAYIAIFSQLIPPAKSFTNSIYNIQRGMAAFDRIRSVLDAEETIRDRSGAQSVNDLQESIEFRNVSFRYEKEYVLRDLNVTLRKGESVALVGRSGAGKSTLADLLPRFYEVEEGSILLDGTPIRDLRIRDLRQLMGIVTQESILFNDSVFNNIAFGVENTTEEAVVEAAKVANAHDFITELEQGYQTNIGDRGDKLSGGQKQRLSIARAILRNPPLLILDEATSALDTESEQLVQAALEKVMENRTSVVIAHRLSTIQHADRILVLEDGVLVEEGDHETLLQKDGVYRKLYELQSFD